MIYIFQKNIHCYQQMKNIEQKSDQEQSLSTPPISLPKSKVHKSDVTNIDNNQTHPHFKGNRSLEEI